MKLLFCAALALAAVGASAYAQTPAPAPAAAAPAAGKLGPSSTFHDLVANPKAKAILDANIPMIMQALEGGVFPDTATLEEVASNEQAQTAGGFTKEAYDKILAELSKL